MELSKALSCLPDYNPADTMGLKQAFKSLLRMAEPRLPQSEDPVSIVLLLREPRFPTLEQLREAAGRAFEVTFTDAQNARHSVYQRGAIFTLANIGAHTLSFLFQTRPYFGNEPQHNREFENSLRRDDQRQALAQHAAYMAIDYVKGNFDIDSRYVVLSKLCAKLYDANCVAIYLPAEHSLVPGREHAFAQLKKIIAYRKVDVT